MPIPLNALDSDQPVLLKGAENGIKPDIISRAALTILQTLQRAGFESYLVGGGVRDILVGLRPKDFDIATAAKPQQVRQLFRRSRMIGNRFVLVHVRIGRELIEVATFRAAPIIDAQFANVNESGRIVRDNEYTATLAEDAKRRDFTINNLYYDPINDTIVDFSGGLNDLRNRTIRMIGDPHQRYQEDPVRILRALRFAAKLAFNIEHTTATPLRKYGNKLYEVSPARLYEEILKLLMIGYAERSYQLLLEYDLFGLLFHKQPENCPQPKTFADQLIRFALADTDSRVAHGKPTTPAFVFAALLWPQLVQHGVIDSHVSTQRQTYVAYDRACKEVLKRLPTTLSLPRRIASITHEIWGMQPLLERYRGAKAERLISQPCFRAAYDFLLLRIKAGAPLQEIANQWMDYQRKVVVCPHSKNIRARTKTGTRHRYNPQLLH